ncbi:MAG: hypothetical protein H7Y31_15510 [Chitinophagaceae bacterium]|nr:hypothetical protein [Chitinophagaceae bacterium]
MKINTGVACCIATVLLLLSCDKKNEDLTTPLSLDQFPAVIVLADEGDGGLEDEDKFSFVITLSDRKDPDGQEPGGKIIPLLSPATVHFEITSFEGFNKLSDYILDASAFYELNDCNTEDVDLTFDVNTGKGTVIFPAGVEEVEIEFETDESLFDDAVFNTDERSITIQLTDLTGNTGKAAVNTSAAFVYEVQDDEGIYGEWKLDINDPAEFNRFKTLFGLVNEDIRNLEVDDVDEILLEFEYEEVKAIVVLKETEQIDDCGSIDTENKIIELEAEIEDVDDKELSGEIEFGEILETVTGSLRAFVYTGSFEIINSKLKIVLRGEFGSDKTEVITLNLEK